MPKVYFLKLHDVYILLFLQQTSIFLPHEKLEMSGLGLSAVYKELVRASGHLGLCSARTLLGPRFKIFICRYEFIHSNLFRFNIQQNFNRTEWYLVLFYLVPICLKPPQTFNALYTRWVLPVCVGHTHTSLHVWQVAPYSP